MRENGADQIVPDPGLNVMLRKPGPATSTLAIAASLSSLALSSFRDIARLHLGGLGQHHGRVDRDVAVGRIARRVRLRLRQGKIGRQLALALQRFERGFHLEFDVGKDVHFNPSPSPLGERDGVRGRCW